MGLSDDWRERHAPRQSGNRVFIYIIFLVLILLLITKADNFSKGFTDIFLGSSDSTSVEVQE